MYKEKSMFFGGKYELVKHNIVVCNHNHVSYKYMKLFRVQKVKVVT